MKKCLIILCLLLISFIISSDNIKNPQLHQFVNFHQLNYHDIKPYINFKRFVIEDYFELESFRIDNNYTHTETVNRYYNSELALAPFKNTYLMLVNKQFYVEKDYQPSSLVNPQDYAVNLANDDILVQKDVLLAYMQMVEDLGLHNLYIFSGYRTYDKQKSLYDYYQDDNYSAKPGHSEHHTGLAIDISTLDSGLTVFFANTLEYNILIKHCHEYGFILRYPENKSKETGYFYEPWHFRYVGRFHATIIMKEKITLEQYLFEYFQF